MFKEPVVGRAGGWLRTVALAAVAVVVGAGGHAPAAAAESNGGVRVMPLGDSITEGTQVPGGYRIGLWQRLSGAGYRIDFTGTQLNGPAALGDHDHEGHPGCGIHPTAGGYDKMAATWYTALRSVAGSIGGTT